MKGVAHVKQDKLDRAQTLFEMALQHATKKDANLDTILYSIAQVYAIAGEYDIAMGYINRTEGNIGGQGYYKRGLINMKSGKFQQALPLFLNHINLQMKRPKETRVKMAESNFSLGICHKELGNFRMAEKALRKSLIEGESLEARIALVNLMFEKGNREKGFYEIKLAVRNHGKGIDTRNYLTNLLLNQINVSDAVLNNLFRRSGESAHCHLRTAILLYERRITRTRLRLMKVLPMH